MRLVHASETRLADRLIIVLGYVLARGLANQLDGVLLHSHFIAERIRLQRVLELEAHA